MNTSRNYPLRRLIIRPARSECGEQRLDGIRSLRLWLLDAASRGGLSVLEMIVIGGHRQARGGAHSASPRRSHSVVTTRCHASNRVRIQATASASVSNNGETGTAQRPKPASMCQPDSFSLSRSTPAPATRTSTATKRPSAKTRHPSSSGLAVFTRIGRHSSPGNGWLGFGSCKPKSRIWRLMRTKSRNSIFSFGILASWCPPPQDTTIQINRPCA